MLRCARLGMKIDGQCLILYLIIYQGKAENRTGHVPGSLDQLHPFE